MEVCCSCLSDEISWLSRGAQRHFTDGKRLWIRWWLCLSWRVVVAGGLFSLYMRGVAFVLRYGDYHIMAYPFERVFSLQTA